MTAYNKLFAAIVSTLLMRWILQYFGLDVSALGVGDDFRAAVSLTIDALTAGVTGFFVWLIPNIEARFR